MTKLCSVCGTENREEAQFCRSCGTAFSTGLPRAATGDDGTQLNVCAECGFQNKPGLRYCANCGMSLAAGAAAADAGGVATGSPPPLSYPSFAPVAPYPPAPALGDAAIPDLPDPDAEIALRQQEAAETDAAAMPFENPPSRGRAPIVIGGVAVALVVAGALAWTYMRGSNPSPPTIGATTPPVAPAVPASAAAAPPIIVEQAPASTAAAVTPPASAVETPPTAAAPIDTTPPAAARPLPQVGDPMPPESAEAEAKRVAAERRAKAAREKAERDAKASAADREQSAAAAQREQDAQARRRAEEGQRARPAPAPAAPPAAAMTQGRTVREICAGRGTIAEAVCQSRTCGQPEHANEPICRQLREQDERRRNYGG